MNGETLFNGGGTWVIPHPLTVITLQLGVEEQVQESVKGWKDETAKMNKDNMDNMMNFTYCNSKVGLNEVIQPYQK